MQISRNDLRRSGRNSAIGTSRMSGGTGNTELSAKAIAPRAQRLWRWCAHAAARPIQPPRVIEASIVLPVWRGHWAGDPPLYAAKHCRNVTGVGVSASNPLGWLAIAPLRSAAQTRLLALKPNRREEAMRGLMSE